MADPKDCLRLPDPFLDLGIKVPIPVIGSQIKFLLRFLDRIPSVSSRTILESSFKK